MHLVQTMAYAGEVPWHGLGNPLAPNQPLEVWAKQAGMDWRIESAEVRFVAGAVSGLGSIHAFPEQQVLYRSDTKAPLSVVSSRYKVVQPAEILEFYRDLTEVGGFELEPLQACRLQFDVVMCDRYFFEILHGNGINSRAPVATPPTVTRAKPPTLIAMPPITISPIPRLTWRVEHRRIPTPIEK